MDVTERRTALDLEGHLDVEYCVFGKFSSGCEGDMGQWDHGYLTVEELRANLDDETVEDALDAYDDLESTWRDHTMRTVREAEEEAEEEAREAEAEAREA